MTMTGGCIEVTGVRYHPHCAPLHAFDGIHAERDQLRAQLAAVTAERDAAMRDEHSAAQRANRIGDRVAELEAALDRIVYSGEHEIHPEHHPQEQCRWCYRDFDKHYSDCAVAIARAALSARRTP
jgi:hypothetical protein